MREIKFRAWNRETKQFELPIYRGVANLNINDILRGSTLLYQQYTGLKDKNGKEIYEGDVLRVERKGVRKEDNSRAIRQVEWINGLACFAFANRPLDDFQREFYGANTSVEIICNIYEHPELLTK